MPMTGVVRSRTNELFRFADFPPELAATLAALFCFAICYFRAFVFPHVPIVLWGDQIGFFNDGSRIVLGELPYRDYFQIVPVGTDLFYAALIKSFGLRAWIPNLTMSFLAGLAAFLMTLIASRLMRGAVVILPSLLFAGFVLLCSQDATHHWFSTVAILGALLVLLDGISLPRVAVAGGLCGLAACFTQTKGATVIVGLLVYFAYHMARRLPDARKRWRICSLLCGVAVVVFLAVNVYFIRAAGIGHWLYCVVVYPLRYYPAPPINNWRVILYDFGYHEGFTRWISYPFVYATVPLVYIVFIVVARRRWENLADEDRDKFVLVAIVGIAMFIAIGFSPSAKRLGSVSPPALILLAWFLDRPGKVAARLRILLAAVSVVLAVGITERLQTRRWLYLDLPAGRAAMLDRALYGEYLWLLENTHPGEYFYGMPPFFYAFHLRSPAAIDAVHDSEYTRPEQVSALVDALKSHQVPLIVFRGLHEALHPKTSPTDHLDPLRAYLKQNYRVIKTFPTTDYVLAPAEKPVPASPDAPTRYAGPS
jgi:hypothetical protein